RIMPRLPTNSTPLPHCGILPCVQSSGFSVPWYQVSVTGAMPSRAGYSYLARIDAGASSGCGGGPEASMVLGAWSFNAQNGRSFQWLPRSDMVPLPKSHQRYHLGPGTYTELNGRCGAGPSHRSQLRFAGGCSSWVGRWAV